MNFPRFHALAARRSATSRRNAMSRRPQLEPMEGRQLLATMPYITMNNPLVTETTGTNSVVSFTVKLTSASADPVVMQYQTIDKLALAGSDYIATSGTLTFAPGEMIKTISVTVIGDSEVEVTENFGMQLSNVQNGIVFGSMGVATILDDDAPSPVTMSVNDVKMKRGLSGERTMVFAVALNKASTTPVTVQVDTKNVTALAGRDYQALSRLVTFNPGETTKLVSITIYGTAAPTSDKIFFFNLSGANVAITRARAAGIIQSGA